MTKLPTHTCETKGGGGFCNLPTHTFGNLSPGRIFAIFLHTLFKIEVRAGFSHSSYTHFLESKGDREFCNLPTHTF